MTDLDQIITLSPIQPTVGPQSRQVGSGMPIPSVAGIRDPYQGFMLTNEAILSLQDQVDTLRQLIQLAPSVNAINFPFLIITDLYLTNNSPSAGNISWTACTVYYQGQAYGIAAGNTTGGAALVWWVVGASTFSSGASFTPTVTTFSIATNTSGTADLAWNKVGSNSIQNSQVLGGFIVGYAPQNPSDVSVTAGTSTTLLNYTGAGGIVSIGIIDLGGQSGCLNSPGMQLSITLDGGSAQNYSIKGATAGPPTNSPWLNEALNSSLSVTGTGNAANDRVVIPFGVSFKTSCLITMSTPGGVVGSGFYVTVNWAKKL